jgi:starvation-inducible outer membrane lipoprotein
MQNGMAWRRAVIGALVLLAAGCASQTAPPPAPRAVVENDQYSALKTSYLAANPDARLGRVAAVLPDQNRLAVADMPVADFRRGDVLSIVDAKFNPVADGTVVDMDSDMLYVQYTQAAGITQPPAAGDLAIRAEPPPRAQ